MWLWRHREQFGTGILALLALAFLIAALWLALGEKSVAAATAGVLGLLILAFVRLSKFKKFRGLGFEAELWDDKQLEAERLISQTRGMLSLLGKTLVTALPRMNRMMEAFTVPDQLAIARDVERMLRDYGVEESDLGDLYGEIDKWHAWDLAAPVQKEFRRKLEAHSRDLHIAVGEKFGSPVKDIEGFNRESVAANEPLTHIFHLKDLKSLQLDQWVLEIERRFAAAPLSESTKQELLTSTGPAMTRLRRWIGSREFTPDTEGPED